MSINKLFELYQKKMKAKGRDNNVFSFLILLYFLIFIISSANSILSFPLQKKNDHLNHPIMYLMTEEERENFLGLRSKTEKEQFMNLFWQKRDPDLTTYDNEYKIEFEKRVAFTNRYFSTCKKKGWKSDRGKVYVLLGPPTETEIERNPVKPGEPKSEVWIYHNIKTGLKFKNLRICFVDEDGNGDYKLSVPRSYGLEDIALQTVRSKDEGFIFSFSIANKNSLKLNTFSSHSITSKSFDISPIKDLHSIVDIVHIRRIFHIDQKPLLPPSNLMQKYDAILPQFQIDFFQKTPYLSYIPITFKLYYRDFIYKKLGTKNYATMDISALLYDKNGTLVNFIGDRVSFGLSKKDKIGDLGEKSFNYQMVMTAPSGEYILHLFVIDKVDKMKTRYVANWVRDIEVPCCEKSSIRISSLILSNQIENILPDQMYLIKKQHPYIFGNLKIIPNVSRTFYMRGNLSVFFQIFNNNISTKNQLNSYKIDYIFYKDGRFFSKAPSQITPKTKGTIRNILINFKLINFTHGKYTLGIKVSDRNSNKTASNEIDFIIK
jgi:GWxTD domain-containing protein